MFTKLYQRMMQIIQDNITTIFGSAITGTLAIVANSNSFDLWLDRLAAIGGIIVFILTGIKLIHQYFIYKRKKNGDR